ncbi:hypothetical protein Erwinia_phage_Aioli_00069 [Erwinia phage Aioli]|nr:hypothetical protein Erwinia_phage_Aioli_00069 [Erwinia phage Aioli]
MANIKYPTRMKFVVQLQGLPLQKFLSFLDDAYPEINGAEFVNNGIMNISDDSMLFKAWEEFDEYCK